jgi:hypothetical protein
MHAAAAAGPEHPPRPTSTRCCSSRRLLLLLLLLGLRLLLLLTHRAQRRHAASRAEVLWGCIEAAGDVHRPRLQLLHARLLHVAACRACCARAAAESVTPSGLLAPTHVVHHLLLVLLLVLPALL